MKLIDRILVCVLALGIWAWVFLSFFSASPLFALSIDIDAEDVDGLRSYVQNVVQDCRVSGDVYVYDVSGSDGYGTISSARIRC